MTAPARIQLPPNARRGAIVEIRVVIQHPMETGFRYDSLGRRTPRNAIQTLQCRYRGSEVFRAAMSTGIAANPYLRFFIRALESGEIELSWIDQENASGTVSARLEVVD
jgi:sulfur-oxidizing protein SoxZ